jgi:hypothetical protein
MVVDLRCFHVSAANGGDRRYAALPPNLPVYCLVLDSASP